MKPPKSRSSRVVACPQHSPAHPTPRRGFTLLEFIVALLLFGVAMSGLFPLVVMYSRVLQSLEQRPNPSCRHTDERILKWYVVPSSDRWARKLGASASIKSEDPGPKPTPPVPTPSGLVADDGDASSGYADVGGDWAAESGGNLGDRRRHAYVAGSPPGSEEKATWTFTNVPPGWYQVQGTWAGGGAADACYALYDGASLATYTPVPLLVSQLSDSYGEDGWQPLTTAYFASGTVSVELSANLTADVVADGVRLVLVENNVQVESLRRSPVGEDEEVTVRVKIEPK
jgi:prepilin-type N-terminal cleavage/methylation domain-containing protein